MTSRRSPFRKAAEVLVASTMKKATRAGMSVKRLRVVLREAFASLKQTTLFGLPKRPRALWYAAIRTVTGGGVRALVDPRQQKLPLDLGPAARRRRSASSRKKTS